MSAPPKPQGAAQWIIATSVLVAACVGLFSTFRGAITWLNKQDSDVVALDAEVAPAVKELREVTKQTAAAVEELKEVSKRSEIATRGVQTWATREALAQIRDCDRGAANARVCEGVYLRADLPNTYGSKALPDVAAPVEE